MIKQPSKFKRFYPYRKLFVAANDDNKVLGYIQMSDYENTYHKSLKNIITLAVDGNHQHEGIGSKLIEHAEQWAKEDGSYGIRLVSGFERKSGHKFYDKHGYEIRKEEINYIKWWN
ncbi:GNAT family N-acetyltransferase [Companilactobacillus paralimentarius]|uniref:GNAT family N-acetyltransferase n=1 Tax=Companilactobacillus paralimentarius TaxID=83526 RepID=UPI00384CBF64